MIKSNKIVPVWVRLLIGLMGLLTVAFSLAPASFLPSGISTDASVPLNAAYLFNSRNIALGTGILIVSIAGVPESIAIVMLIRLVIEIADRIALIPLITNITAGNLLPPFIPEITAYIKLNQLAQ